MSRFTYGYWKIRGLAQATRLMLHSADAQWENVMYEQGDAPEFSRACWTDVKNTLGLDFPNLPYLIDSANDVRLTQSMAILRYLAAEVAPQLLKPGSKLDSHIDMLAEQSMDLRNALVRIYYGSKDKDAGLEALKGDSVTGHLASFEKYLSRERDGAFLVGPLCYTDFFLADHLDQLEFLAPGTLAAYPNLEAYHRAFFELPKIKEYVSTRPALPVNNKSAKLK